jgi:L,D-transpeptidase ErfK/SrfK
MRLNGRYILSWLALKSNGSKKLSPSPRTLVSRIWAVGLISALLSALVYGISGLAFAYDDGAKAFEARPLVAYALSNDGDNIIGQLRTYQIKKGETLLDIARRYDLTAREVSEANHGLDWWQPPVGRTIVLPTEWIIPPGPRQGVVLNIPEMRLYYFPGHVGPHPKKGGLKHVAFVGDSTVYTFPVGLGRYDWRTPIGAFRVRGKTVNPTWVVPDDIYQEHLERDGEAEHVVPGGVPDNPLGLYRIELTLPQYAIHGTDTPWGIGMETSHGCVRLYPEDIKRLFYKVKIGTPGRFVYYPVKFGWRGGGLYVEVHRDIYGRYPGLWQFALNQAKLMGVADKIDHQKLEKAITEETGVPTYVMQGENPDNLSAGR